MSIFKRILGVGGGVALGMAFVMGGDYCTYRMVQLPETMDLQKIAEAMALIPVKALLPMLAGYMLGSFLGGMLATLITGREALRPAMMVGIILTVGSILNQMDIPHPLWFTIVSTLIFIPSAWSGWRVLARKPA